MTSVKFLINICGDDLCAVLDSNSSCLKSRFCLYCFDVGFMTEQ